MKRYFLMACLTGLLAAATGQAQPTIDLGRNIIASQESVGIAAERPTSGPVSSLSNSIGPRGEPVECAPTGVCVGPGACATGGCRSSGERWDRFTNWLCYRSDNGKLLPCFRPTPYRPPLYNWFPCQEACAPGCGAQGCGGPPITYYYPTKQHPAPPAPKSELRAPHTLAPGSGTAQLPAAQQPALIPGLRFASAETPRLQDRKRAPAVTPAMATTPSAPLAARPNEAPADVDWTSLKRSDPQR